MRELFGKARALASRGASYACRPAAANARRKLLPLAAALGGLLVVRELSHPLVSTAALAGFGAFVLRGGYGRS